jgi:hypothetical protein
MLANDKLTPEYLRKKLLSFNEKIPLKGLHSTSRFDCFLYQLMDGLKRIDNVTCLLNTIQIKPCLEEFNPLAAAVYYKQQGNLNEAFWLAFLSTNFGEHEVHRWQLVQDIYYGLSNTVVWNWDNICSDINGFRLWLQSNNAVLKERGSFSNHRKYESLKDQFTGKTIASYIDWIGPTYSHQDLIKKTISKVGDNPFILFDALYNSMEVVWRFGRTAKFDYLCLLSKLGLADIIPGSPYLQDATGPLVGARLLFGKKDVRTLNNLVWKLGLHLDLPLAMQALEDTICNWQKNQDTFISFLH